MGMLDLFTIKELQHVVTILEELRIKKITKHADIVSFIRTEVETRRGVFEAVETKSHNVKNTCPKCNKGILSFVKNYENLIIYGCGKCRYSEIREENNG